MSLGRSISRRASWVVEWSSSSMSPDQSCFRISFTDRRRKRCALVSRGGFFRLSYSRSMPDQLLSSSCIRWLVSRAPSFAGGAGSKPGDPPGPPVASSLAVVMARSVMSSGISSMIAWRLSEQVSQRWIPVAVGRWQAVQVNAVAPFGHEKSPQVKI